MANHQFPCPRRTASSICMTSPKYPGPSPSLARPVACAQSCNQQSPFKFDAAKGNPEEMGATQPVMEVGRVGSWALLKPCCRHSLDSTTIWVPVSETYFGVWNVINMAPRSLYCNATVSFKTTMTRRPESLHAASA